MRVLLNSHLNSRLRLHPGNLVTDKKIILSLNPVVGIRHRYKSGKCESVKCCNDAIQHDEKKLCGFPKDAIHSNYDTYKIKVSNLAVPSMPPCNAKPMFDCTKKKSPCSVLPPQGPSLGPPCPPPPKRPFPWIYVWPIALFMTAMGITYKAYLVWLKIRKGGDNKVIWRPRAAIKRPYSETDLPPCVQYLLIGAGAASWSAYQAIRQHDKKAKVFFITNEDCYPYRRPPMSREMWWNTDPPNMKTLNYVEEKVRKSMYNIKCPEMLDPEMLDPEMLDPEMLDPEMLDPVSFYRKKIGPAVSVATGWCVLRVDPENHVAYVKTMTGERPIYYERCLLAPGARAKNLTVFKSAPKAVREKIITLRNIRDLELAFRRVRDAKHVTVVGAGPLGCELAWYLGKSNDPNVVDKTSFEMPYPPPPTKLALVYKDKGVLSGIFPEYLGEWLAERLRCVNINMVSQTQVYDAFLTPDNRLELTLSNGSSLKTDFVIVAVGVIPRTDIAEASDLEIDHVNGGILVNTEMQARNHLYCAGDAASYYSQWKNTRMRTPHYDNAVISGTIAGKNMTGYWETNNMEPHFWFTLGPEVQIQVVGEVGACMPTVGLWKECDKDEYQIEERRKEKEKDLPCFKDDAYAARYKRGMIFYLRDETVVGIALWNIPPIEDRKEVVEELLRAKPNYKDINMLANILGFPETHCTYLQQEQAAKANMQAAVCMSNLKKW